MAQRKKVLLELRGKFVEIMCSVNPQYTKCIVYEGEKKQKVLYLHVLRALYGCLELVLLWYNLYSKLLKDMGFEINPYDKCVMNKTINGLQCTIVFYVDDNKISHEGPEVVSEILGKISNHFEELSLTRGTKFKLLGMDIKVKDKNIHISMKDQLVEAIQMYGD